MNEVANIKSAGALAALGNLKQGLQNIQQNIRVAGGEPIMRMGRDGKWVYGADNVEDNHAETGNLWAFNPLSIRQGYVCWKKLPQGSKDKAELYGRHSYSMQVNPLPDKASLQAYDSNNVAVDHSVHEWDEFIGVDIMCVDGDDKDEVSTYDPSSTGGIRAMRDLLAKIGKQIDDDPAHPVPVIALKSDHYDNKTWGKIYVPLLEIVRWVSLNDATDTGEPAKEPVKEPVKEAAPAQQPVKEEPAPAAAAAAGGERRRRRAA